MEPNGLIKHFEAMGGRIRLRPNLGRRLRGDPPLLDGYALGIANDRRGEYFDLAVGREMPDFRVLQVARDERHLLLWSADGQRLLCGHDERHWFVAGIAKPVSTVREAKRSLMPKEVWERTKVLRPREALQRRNPVFLRQGEWFFVPQEPPVERFVVHRSEPLVRPSGGKPHVCDQLVRVGGHLVYVVGKNVYSQEEYRERTLQNRGFASQKARLRVADPTVYVRGAVRHPDHATLTLDRWHRVFLNGELRTAGVSFLD